MAGASESGAPRRSSRFGLTRVLRVVPTPARVALGLGLIVALDLAERARDVAGRIVGVMDTPTDKPAVIRPKISTGDFAELSRRIRMDGGGPHATAHTPKDIKLAGEDDKIRPGGTRTSGCGLQRCFEVPYRDINDEIQHVHVCADCDDVAHWPRFAGHRGQEAAIENASDF